jgi:hypothetical protein
MDSLEQTLLNLKESIFKCNDIPLDILSMLLSDAEVAKNIILSQNPKMTKLDADIMIDGDISSDLKSKLGQNFSEKKLGKLSPGDPSNLIKSLDGKTAYKIANKSSNLLQQSIPSDAIPSEVAEISNKAQNILQQLNVVGANGVPNFNREDILIKQKAADFARQNGIYPLPDNSVYHTQAKQFKQEFRKSMTNIFNQQVEMIEKFVIKLIDDIASIAAAAQLIAPVSFNVPAAITLILRVIESIIDFCALVRHLPDFIEPIIRYLPLVVKPEMQSVVKGFLVGIASVLSIFSCLCATLTIQKKKLKDSLSEQVGATTGGEPYRDSLEKLKKVGIGTENDVDLSSIIPPLNPIADFYEYRYDVDIQSATGSVTLKDLSLEDLEELKEQLNNIVFQPSPDIPTNL